MSVDAVIGRLHSIDLVRALRLAGDAVCGGLAQMPIQGEEYAVLRHAMRVEDLQPSQIDDLLIPLYVITGTALQLETQLASMNQL